MLSADNLAENPCRWPSLEYFSKLNLNEIKNPIHVIITEQHLLSCFYQILYLLSFLIIAKYKIKLIILNKIYIPPIAVPIYRITGPN